MRHFKRTCLRFYRGCLVVSKFQIQKEVLQPHFLSLNIDAVGRAVERLKPCGLKLYLYLMSNSDGFTWNMNPVAFANWMGVDSSNASQARRVRKMISEGIIDLQEKGFLKDNGMDSYIISEQFVPEWLSSQGGTNCSSQVALKEQIVPKVLLEKSTAAEQFVPENKGSMLGTNCSSEDAEKEKIVPDCYGF